MKVGLDRDSDDGGSVGRIATIEHSTILAVTIVSNEKMTESNEACLHGK